MEKLNFFTFNNIRFQYRLFERADEVTPIAAGQYYRAFDLLLFEVNGWDSFVECKQRLFDMISFQGEILETTEHFVDAAGIAWPSETIVIIQNANDKTSPCVLLMPQPKF